MTELKNQPILVAVANSDHVEQLVRAVGDLARLLDTRVKMVSVIVKPHGSPFSMDADEMIIETFSGDTQEMLDAATTVAPDDVPVDHEMSVSHSVADGPHVPSAALAAKAIAVRNDATVHVLSVGESDSDPDAAKDDIATATLTLEEAPGPDIRIETLLQTGEDVSDAIAETVPDYDVIIFGATRHGAVRRRLVGSIPQPVSHRTDRTVLLARSGAVVGRTGLRYVERLWDQS
ncbi:universal stress protein UspA [Halostagnicola larsenii XH-48]|uniref:Universal stress protein UspA n=1 Tax=Halostagnicola larsenii XH-48 TaxID=797299 RepID=W0JM18_9EURY|nr:universal stress protein [Halostagnicola larsenii]AHF99638.1 universal stress protein UspA [Halostagnicola larsenii XH-48]